jgi:16S rRNA (guanine966-N2)-methyltransferase
VEAGRVIAGTARGIRLRAPGEGTRPFADRVKQTVFAIVEPDLDGAVVLDLCAGSGAAGIEALSRGAARAVFVERDADAVLAIRENLRRTAVADRAVVIRRDVLRYLAGGEAEWPADLVILDPPYAETGLRDAALTLLGAPADDLHPLVLRAGGRVVATHRWREAPADHVGLLASERVRRFGETAVSFYRRREA